MAVPKRRTSHSKTRMGRAHHGMKATTVVFCTNCGEAKRPHRVCENCGQYRERNYSSAKDE